MKRTPPSLKSTMSLVRFSLSLLLVCLSSTSLAQFGWVSQLVNTEEHLIHREIIGAYTVSADGQRLLHDPYLSFDIRHNGKALDADATVTLNTTLFGHETRANKVYQTRYDKGRFVTPLDLEQAQAWSWDKSGWLRLEITIDGPAGTATGVSGIQIYPAKPDIGWWFSALSIAIPFGLLGLFALIFNSRKVKLQREHAQLSS